MKRPGQRSVAREGLVKFAGARQSFGVELNKGVERGAILVVGGNAIEIALRERDAIERPGPEGIMYLADRGFFQREGYSLVLPSCADSALQWNMAGSARHSPGPLSYDAAALLCSRQLNMPRKRSIDNRTTSAGRGSATASSGRIRFTTTQHDNGKPKNQAIGWLRRKLCSLDGGRGVWFPQTWRIGQNAH